MKKFDALNNNNSLKKKTILKSFCAHFIILTACICKPRQKRQIQLKHTPILLRLLPQL